MNRYDVITTRSYMFDDNGHYSENLKGAVVNNLWEVNVAEREILIPDIDIHHIHARSSGSGTTKRWLNSVDSVCVCGKRFPLRILDDIYTINRTKYPQTYSALERGSYYRLTDLKKLSDQWYLDENKKLPAPSLFHVCNEYHPAYLYYGKGIPLSQIAMPPWPDKCKTCRVDIPKGIRVAMLMMKAKIKL